MENKEILDFLKALKRNNNRVWFKKNHDRYQTVRAEFIEFTQNVINDFGKRLPEIRHLKAKKCIFRIARDVRFSHDKSPYKTNMSAALSRGGKKSDLAFFYFHIQPGNKTMIAGGVYMPPADVLKKIRHLIDKDPYSLIEILENKKFKKYFTRGLDPEQKLKTSPKGWDKEHEHIDLLRYKSFTVTREFSDAEFLKMDFKKEILKGFELLIPFAEYLNKYPTAYL